MLDFSRVTPIAQIGQVSSKKSPDGSKRLPFTDDGVHWAHWTLQCCRNASVSWSNSVLEVYRQFLTIPWTLWLGLWAYAGNYNSHYGILSTELLKINLIKFSFFFPPKWKSVYCSHDQNKLNTNVKKNQAVTGQNVEQLKPGEYFLSGLQGFCKFFLPFSLGTLNSPRDKICGRLLVHLLHVTFDLNFSTRFGLNLVEKFIVSSSELELCDCRYAILWCGGSSNQQWCGHSQSLHLFGHIDHLIQRRGDKTRQTNDIWGTKASTQMLLQTNQS